MSKSQIHLIRHGLTEGNVKRWYYGSSDIPLLEEGVAELLRLAQSGIYPVADETQERGPAIIYTSGLLRTEQTLAAIYGDRQHDRIEELAELRFGDYERKSHEDLKEEPIYQKWIGDKSGESGPPGGESPLQFYERVRQGFDKLLELHGLHELSVADSGKEAHSIAVCHGGVISAIMTYQFPSEGKDLYGWIPDTGHGYSLILENGKAVQFSAF